jgi:hypothetical protein
MICIEQIQEHLHGCEAIANGGLWSAECRIPGAKLGIQESRPGPTDVLSSFMQNKANFRDFWAKNEDRRQKQSQLGLFSPSGPAETGESETDTKCRCSRRAKRAKQSQFRLFWAKNGVWSRNKANQSQLGRAERGRG